MALIRIVASGLSLDFVRESLTIKRENNALITDFKVNHSVFPFLVLENLNTIRALGKRDITSVNKVRIIPVDVFELGEKFYGELQVLTYVNGYRKCNLKYSSQVLQIMPRKISEFMPVVSVIPGENNPVPFSDVSMEVVPGSIAWTSYPGRFTDKHYPETKWQFPTLIWQDQFGENLEQTDEWFPYKGRINNFDVDGNFYINTVSVSGDEVTAVNQNVPSPQIFILSPLFYALDSINFKLVGDFSTHELIRRITLLSLKNNLTKVEVLPVSETLTFNGSWIPEEHPFGYQPYTTYAKNKVFTFGATGTYVLKYKFTIGRHMPFASNNCSLLFSFDGYTEAIFYLAMLIVPRTFEGKATFTITDDNIGESLLIRFSDRGQVMPLEYSLEMTNSTSTVFHEMHPTIEMGRYVPDWTFGDYLNQLKKLFNLDITQNDQLKQLEINFVDDFMASEVKATLAQSLEVVSIDPLPYSAIILKYANDEDDALYITRSAVEKLTSQQSDFDLLIESKFKYVPHSGLTSVVSQELEDKDGVGLMIYDPFNMPFTSDSFDNKNLTIDKQGGIHETFWLKTIKIRLTASVLELSGPLTETELAKIKKIKKIYADNQAYNLVSISYTETLQENFIIKMNLESINP